MRELKEIVGLSRSTIYAKIATGEFPKPRRLTTATVGWQLSELMAWIDSRPAADGSPR